MPIIFFIIRQTRTVAVGSVSDPESAWHIEPEALFSRRENARYGTYRMYSNRTGYAPGEAAALVRGNQLDRQRHYPSWRVFNRFANSRELFD